MLRSGVAFLVAAAALAACSGGESDGGAPAGSAGAGSGASGGADASGGRPAAGAAGLGGSGGSAGGSGAGGTSGADSGGAAGTAGVASGACGDAIDITADLTSAKYSGTVSAAAPDPISCALSAPRIYLKATLEAGNYAAWLSTPAGASDPSAPAAALAIRVDCADPQSELACNDRALFLNPKFSLARRGTIYILVHGEAFTQGFELSISQNSRSCFSCSSLQKCHPAGACVQCLSATDCATGAVCDPDWAYCRACKTSADCVENPHGASCDPATGRCGCLSASDCTGTDQICGAAGACMQCRPGFNDCNGASFDGCESDPQSDPNHCGACGRSCQGGACNKGVCSPAPELLIDDNAGLLAVDDSDVFYTRALTTINKQIKRVAPTGGAATQVVDVSDGSSFDGLALDAANLYFSGRFSGSSAHPIYSVPRGGGVPAQIGSQSATFSALLRVDAGDLYYRSGPSTSGNSVYRIPLPTGSATKIVDDVGYYALSASHVVFPSVVSSGLADLYAVPKSGGAASLVAAQASYCTEVAADGTAIYFIGPDSRSLSRVPVGGGPPQVLLPSSSHPYSGCLSKIQVSDDAVYLMAAGQYGALLKIPKAGGAYSAIASVRSPTDVALSSTHIYWTASGAIRRLPL
jgi:hypothetical protein